MRSLRLELAKILNQKRTYIGWLGLVLVPLIVSWRREPCKSPGRRTPAIRRS